MEGVFRKSPPLEDRPGPWSRWHHLPFRQPAIVCARRRFRPEAVARRRRIGNYGHRYLIWPLTQKLALCGQSCLVCAPAAWGGMSVPPAPTAQQRATGRAIEETCAGGVCPRGGAGHWHRAGTTPPGGWTRGALGRITARVPITPPRSKLRAPGSVQPTRPSNLRQHWRYGRACWVAGARLVVADQDAGGRLKTALSTRTLKSSVMYRNYAT